ncbi:MAG TPA: host attachment protein [Terriglobales bacterium]|jgi:peptide subunit release factor 1 (eRF1)|nr:host attachment protein [Terriglobales bacterium]
MITREDIRELAQFHASGDEAALSFYFEPRTPQNKSHHEEIILAKDLVRRALHEAEKTSKNGSTRADLNRILEMAENLHGNQARARAVFACGSRNFWREFDLPSQLPGTQLFVNRQFHLKPLALLLGAQPRLWVALVDRQKARFFDLRLDELKEREGMFRTPPGRQGRGDGYAGYDGGHAQRRVNDEALHHFKSVAEHLSAALEKGLFEKLIIGCHETSWRELEPQLHPYVKQRLLGHFSSDLTRITNEQIREQAGRILRQSLDQRCKELAREAISQAKSNARGVTGLRRVLKSLEMGEVQTLLIGDKFSHLAVQCSNCGHLDAHMVRHCPACGHETREIEDVTEAIIPAAIRRDIELFYVKDDPEFDRAGNIAALLRFRADQNKGGGLRAAS